MHFSKIFTNFTANSWKLSHISWLCLYNETFFSPCKTDPKTVVSPLQRKNPAKKLFSCYIGQKQTFWIPKLRFFREKARWKEYFYSKPSHVIFTIHNYFIYSEIPYIQIIQYLVLSCVVISLVLSIVPCGLMAFGCSVLSLYAALSSMKSLFFFSRWFLLLIEGMRADTRLVAKW